MTPIIDSDSALFTSASSGHSVQAVVRSVTPAFKATVRHGRPNVLGLTHTDGKIIPICVSMFMVYFIVADSKHKHHIVFKNLLSDIILLT